MAEQPQAGREATKVEAAQEALRLLQESVKRLVQQIDMAKTGEYPKEAEVCTKPPPQSFGVWWPSLPKELQELYDTIEHASGQLRELIGY
jgi:hypothetical protein